MVYSAAIIVKYRNRLLYPIYQSKLILLSATLFSLKLCRYQSIISTHVLLATIVIINIRSNIST
jgi:hypothetical protein